VMTASCGTAREGRWCRMQREGAWRKRRCRQAPQWPPSPRPPRASAFATSRSGLVLRHAAGGGQRRYPEAGWAQGAGSCATDVGVRRRVVSSAVNIPARRQRRVSSGAW
jgi:hypothetical protein